VVVFLETFSKLVEILDYSSNPSIIKKCWSVITSLLSRRKVFAGSRKVVTGSRKIFAGSHKTTLHTLRNDSGLHALHIYWSVMIDIIRALKNKSYHFLLQVEVYSGCFPRNIFKARRNPGLF
jgi:hypothetical protein